MTSAERDDRGAEPAIADAGQMRAAPELETRKKVLDKGSFGRAVNGWVGIGLVGIGVVASAALPVYALIRAIRYVFR